MWPAKPDAIVLLKRSKSVACTTTTPPPTTPPLVARTPPPLQSSLVTAALAGDSKACRSGDGLLDFVDEISPRTATLGVVNKRPTEHRSEQEIPSAHPVYESPLWMLPRLFRSRSVGCGRNSFSVDQDDISESGLKTEAKGHTSAYVDDKKAAMTKAKSKQAKSRSPRSVIVAATSADHMKIDKEERQAKAKRQLSVKPKGLFGGFGKSSATLIQICFPLLIQLILLLKESERG
ncbi:hypothetical protein SUGI_0240930 [Cryptomeria japonica]|nr:hypothetical protein SUGI_0240930 [Cryptomeria japonica]